MYMYNTPSAEGSLKGRHGRIAKDSNGKLHLIPPGDEGGDEQSVEELSMCQQVNTV